MTYCEFCQKKYFDPREHFTSDEHIHNLKEPHIRVTRTARGISYYIKYKKPGSSRFTIISFTTTRYQNDKTKCMNKFKELFPTKKIIVINNIDGY